MPHPVLPVLFVALLVSSSVAEDLSQLPFPVRNVVPPLDDEDDPRASFRRPPGSLPIEVGPVIEHRRGEVPVESQATALFAVGVEGRQVVAQGVDGAFYELVDDPLAGAARWTSIAASTAQPILQGTDPSAWSLDGVRAIAKTGDVYWLATSHGLYRASAENQDPERHPSYGTHGPLATDIRDIQADSEGRLYLATPLGLSIREPDGVWHAIRGREGLPVVDLTAIAIDPSGDLWIGSTHGLIHYRPNSAERRWFYRAGPRYLPDDRVHDVAIANDGRTIYAATGGGLGRLDLVTTTLEEKARTIERILNDRHRRLGLVSSCTLHDADQPERGGVIVDKDNDGLWTAYHVAAMSLAYAATGDAAAKESAAESMHALYMLQDASGTPGLVARSVQPLDEARRLGKDKDPQWRLTPDGTMYWKSDTSADEIDGHYLAFYTYWEHVARHDPAERQKCLDHVRALTDYIVDNGYVLLDWDGQRTYWGFWSPELLNDRPEHYLENGLNSLQILSFLKTAYHMTGDQKYQQHYESLIAEQRYLDNVLLEKKVFPDSNNHSDNQLAYIAWYPILQTEQDPAIRRVLRQAVRRHYKCLARDRSSFFYFVTATIEPDYVDLEGAILNLQRIPTDRRQWRMTNSHRADVIFDPRVDRFGKRQLLSVLPADERNFDRWNQNVYLPDGGGSGAEEDDGAAFLLPYWLARVHGLLGEAGH